MIERLVSIGTLQSSIENLTLRTHKAEGGLGHWETFNGPGPSKNTYIKSWSRIQQFIYKIPFVDDIANTATAVGAVVQISGLGSPAFRGALNIFQAAAQFAMAPKNNIGGDGSDQVRFLVHGLIGINQISKSPVIKSNALWGIALQANLAYFVSGVTKLAGSEWRERRAIVGVMRTRSYGHQKVWKILKNSPKLARSIELITMGLEITYPLVFIRNKKITAFYIGGVSCMHIAIGALMGLNRFVPAFLSMQPAVVACVYQNKEKPVSLPKVYGVMVCGVFLSGLVLRWIYSPNNNNSGVYGTFFHASSGNVINYEKIVSEDENRNTTTIIFENGLSATKECWLKVVENLKSDYNCIIYDRPGTGLSTAKQNPNTWSSYYQDLHDLVEHTCHSDNKIIMCGHSLGGYLIQSKNVEEMSDKVVGTILLDPANRFAHNKFDPTMSEYAEKKGTDNFLKSIRSLELNTSLGLGWMLDRDLWRRSVSSSDRKRYLDRIYTSPAIWKNAESEWKMYLLDSKNQNGHDNKKPVQILVAGQTTQRNTDYIDAYNNLVKAGPGPSRMEVIPGATHDGMLSADVHAKHVSHYIKTYIHQLTQSGQAKNYEW